VESKLFGTHFNNVLVDFGPPKGLIHTGGPDATSDFSIKYHGFRFTLGRQLSADLQGGKWGTSRFISIPRSREEIVGKEVGRALWAKAGRNKTFLAEASRFLARRGRAGNIGWMDAPKSNQVPAGGRVRGKTLLTGMDSGGV